MGGGGWWVGGLFDFRVTPKSKFMLDVHLDVEFDNCQTFQFHNQEVFMKAASL